MSHCCLSMNFARGCLYMYMCFFILHVTLLPVSVFARGCIYGYMFYSIIDVTLLPVSVFTRGCVPQSLIAEAELDQCYHGDLHDTVISALFQDANFTYTDSSVCFCDERRKPGCNNKMADDMMEMRQTTPAPTTTPPRE